MKLLDSINCEPYGYIKYENNDVDTIIINEVEDIKQNTDIELQEVKHIYVKLITYLTLSIPTNIILDKLNNHNITTIAFYFYMTNIKSVYDFTE